MWTNTLKPYDILSEDQVQQIHDHAMQILQEIGVDFLYPRALDTFRRAGVKIEESRVHFEPGFIEEQIRKVPETFQVQARNPKNTVTIGGNHMVNAPVYGPPFITDLDRGRRGATIADYSANGLDSGYVFCGGGPCPNAAFGGVNLGATGANQNFACWRSRRTWTCIGSLQSKAIEEEPVRPGNARNSRHSASLPKS